MKLPVLLVCRGESVHYFRDWEESSSSALAELSPEAAERVRATTAQQLAAMQKWVVKMKVEEVRADITIKDSTCSTEVSIVVRNFGADVTSPSEEKHNNKNFRKSTP